MAQEQQLLAITAAERKNPSSAIFIKLQQELLQHEHLKPTPVVAPAAGIIGTLGVHPHQMIAANQRLLTLLPEQSPLQTVLIVPSRAAGFIQAGQQVIMRYSAFPYQNLAPTGHHYFYRSSRHPTGRHQCINSHPRT